MIIPKKLKKKIIKAAEYVEIGNPYKDILDDSDIKDLILAVADEVVKDINIEELELIALRELCDHQFGQFLHRNPTGQTDRCIYCGAIQKKGTFEIIHSDDCAVGKYVEILFKFR